MSPTQETALVLELYETILNQIDDISTLKSCSLTCSAFRKTSQKRLLQKISFDLSQDPTSPERFFSFLYAKPCGPGSDFVNHFKTLEIHRISTTNPDTDYTYLIAILPLFHNITDFLLGGSGRRSPWSSFPLALRRAFVAFFLSNPITHLSIGVILKFQYTLLNCFSNLKHLSLNLMNVSTDMQDHTQWEELPEKFPEGKVVLESLAFGSRPETSEISEWMVNPGSRLDVSKLKAYSYTQRTKYTIPLDSVSSTLEYLIFPSEHAADQDFFQTLQTLHFPNLHTVQLPIPQYVRDPSPSPPPYTLSFSLHPQNVVITIILELRIEIRGPWIDEPAWTRAADIFRQANVENVKCLERVIVRAPNALDFREMIEKSFGWFNRRGMLRIENGSDLEPSWASVFRSLGSAYPRPRRLTDGR